MPSRPPHISIALISMPWSLFNRPSIQLGSLKSYLEQHQNIEVDCFHPYLQAAKEISPEIYGYLSKNSWAGEALYSAVLYPDEESGAKKLFQKCCSDNKAVAKGFDTLVLKLSDQLESWLSSVDWNGYDLIGFSVCFSQLFASLTAAKKIHADFPDSTIVFGGSNCIETVSEELLYHFPFISHIIEGEGEKQLEELCLSLPLEKEITTNIHRGIPQQDINMLPTPDYTSYFNELVTVFPDIPFSPTLPIEFSRGCWWNKCAFCNLNMQWHGYRYKQASKVRADVEKLIKQFQCLDFTFCDNALPPKEADSFFQAFSQKKLDLHFFAEVRSITDPEQLGLYSAGGLKSVQAGIEAFSTSLLKKMNKGVRVIDNLAIMKYCTEAGIQLDGNMIVEFPSTTEDEIKETLANLDFAFPFRPLSAAAFFLGSGSPMEQSPEKFSLGKLVSHRNYAYLFPHNKKIQRNMLIKDYKGEKSHQKKIWQPVRDTMRRWQKYHNGRNDTACPLRYRDGGHFLLIRQERVDGKPLLHRLKGASRKLYLSCSTVRNIEDVFLEFPDFNKKTVLKFFIDLSNKRLLYMEDNAILSLAVHQSWKH